MDQGSGKSSNGLRHFNLNLLSGQFEKYEMLRPVTGETLTAIIRKMLKDHEPVVDAVLSGARIVGGNVMTTSGSISVGGGY